MKLVHGQPSPFTPRPGISHVIFDFDGTLSWLRHGWPQLMFDVFRPHYPARPGEHENQIHDLLVSEILSLNGKQTIFQMTRFHERVRERGGECPAPEDLFREYQSRLDTVIALRSQEIQSGQARADEFIVHGALPFLEKLRRRGLRLIILSGSVENRVREEAELLGLAGYFDVHIYGAPNGSDKFSKKLVIDRLLREEAISGRHLLSFGDGPVEIQETKKVGGLAIAVASSEETNGGGVADARKQEQLLQAGADAVVADFGSPDVLLRLIFGDDKRKCVSCVAMKPPVDLTKLRVYPLAERASMARLEDILVSPDSAPPPCSPQNQTLIQHCARQIVRARERQATVMLIYGAHLIKNGAAKILVRLLEGGWITHLATNGAGVIHDWEFAFAGVSTESVKKNVAAGTFGTWEETGRAFNLSLLDGALEGRGIGDALGKFTAEDGLTLPSAETLEAALRSEPSHPLAPARADLLQAIRVHHLAVGRHQMKHPWKETSLLAQSFQRNIPLTVHPGIGYDIISNHPLFNGAAIGRAAQVDFSSFTNSAEGLDNGVVLSVGSAIMGPQVFEKSLSCVNNLRLQAARPIVSGHTIYVVDLQDGGQWDWSQGEPPKDNPAYYLRFCKSYSRMGGDMRYLQCDNVAFLHHLLRELKTLK